MKTIYLFTAILFLSEITSATGNKQINSQFGFIENKGPDYAKASSGKQINSQFGFIENKGQIIDQNNKPNPACLFLYNGGSLHVQLKQNSFSYEVWQKAGVERRAGAESDTSTQPVLSGIEGLSMTNDTSYIHRIDVSFLNANKNPIIIASDISSDYINYYTTGTPEEGVTHVRHFKKVLYQNIYPNIDVEFVLNDLEQNGAPIAIGVKYNFIIHPGGNPKDILIKFDGATNASLNAEGNILIETAYGNIEESIPESYQMDNNNSKQNITASYYSFHASPFTFGISPGNYDASKMLVVDPWATYYGGSGNDYGNGIDIDSSGNTLIIGQTTSPSSIATSGAYQTTHGSGSWDAFIVKFNVAGVRGWATYYGGSGADVGKGIVVNGGGNILITGHTNSISGIATSGAYQTSFGGTQDAFIARFNASGVRIWATYYGGSYNDWGQGIAVDGSGYIVITGQTYSTSGIATSGAYQTSYGGGNDAFIAKFNASGALWWATYYGGSGADIGNGIASDGSGNIVITGNTVSLSGIVTSGAYQTNLGGSDDAFIAKFNASGVLGWATYYGGASDDYGYSIAVDGSGNIFMTGKTYSTSGIATSGAFQTNSGVVPSALIAKFNSSGALNWATYYGGNGGDYGNGIAADGSGNIVIIGRTSSSLGIATSGAFQTSLGGSVNAFIARFNTSGALGWASYFGGNGYDVGIGIAVDSGNIVITGIATSTSGIATSGAYQTSFGGSYDAFVASFTSSGNLPVKLISFDAKLLSNKEVLLSWQTASETNNDFFEVERNANHELPGTPEDHWVKIGTVKGAGNSNAIRTYQFIDALFPSPIPPFSPSSKLYYRLKQVDYDGSYTYSKAVAVKIDEAMQDEPIIFPNPSNGNFVIQTKYPINEIEIFDLNGKSKLKITDVSATQQTLSTLRQVNLSHEIKDGIYILKIISDDGIVFKKIEVLK